MTVGLRIVLLLGAAGLATSGGCVGTEGESEKTPPIPIVQVTERDGTCDAVSIDLISADTKSQIASGELVPVGGVTEETFTDGEGRHVRRAAQAYVDESTGEAVQVTCDGRCDDNCPPPTGCYPLAGGCTECGDCTGWWCGPCICTKGQIRVIEWSASTTSTDD